VIVGFVIALAIAIAARQRSLLRTSGAVAAIVMGTLAMSAGVRWGVLLVIYFLAATSLSAWRRTDKALRTADVVEKTGPRDAWQVLANGSAFVTAALAAELTDASFAIGAALGALAASMADTAATEVGSAIGGEPRSIVTGQKVRPGQSGGVTVVGSLAMIAGSCVVGTCAVIVGFSTRMAWSAIAGGIVGALADSLLGSTVQERRRCPACGTLTERRLHSCSSAGVPTAVVGGVRGFDNDWVNLTSTAIGALVAAAFNGGGV
jgi:uncharacterized protein (TIGR00297 family)